jgi:hypothetical protein
MVVEGLGVECAPIVMFDSRSSPELVTWTAALDWQRLDREI